MPIIDKKISDRYAVYNADCMEVLKDLKSETIGFSLFSPPFPELYCYSNDRRDGSNCVNYEEGIAQLKYTVDEILRLTKTGREMAIHCMDLKKGSMYQNDFPGDIVRICKECGWNFFFRITIRKDPWDLARRTRMRSLMHKTLVDDSSKSRVAGPDYILVFRKGGENLEKISHPNGLKHYAGSKKPPAHLVTKFKNYTGDQKKNYLSHWIWRRYADPIWDDIRLGRLLPYKEARENEEEKHVCPFSIDIVERLLTLYSNPDDIILEPYSGVGTTACAALQFGRKVIASELKPTYFRQSIVNIEDTLKNPWYGEKNDLFSRVNGHDEEIADDASMDYDVVDYDISESELD